MQGKQRIATMDVAILILSGKGRDAFLSWIVYGSSKVEVEVEVVVVVVVAAAVATAAAAPPPPPAEAVAVPAVAVAVVVKVGGDSGNTATTQSHCRDGQILYLSQLSWPCC